jgi:anti-sigma B factor antagonist
VEIRQTRLGALLVLKPVGRLDAVTSGVFQAMLLTALTGGPADVVIDFAEVEYISSAGFRALLEAAKLKSAGSRVGVATLSEPVRETFVISRFVHVLPIFASVDEAADSWADRS